MKNNIIQCLTLDYRFEIIKFIRDNGEVSVSDIINKFTNINENIKQSIISQTLKMFRESGLVDFKSEKQKHIYFIKNEHISDLIDIIEKILNE